MVKEVKLCRKISLNATYKQAQSFTRYIKLYGDIVKYTSSIINSAMINKQHIEIQYLSKHEELNALPDSLSTKILNEGNLVSNMFISLIVELTIPLFENTDINEQDINVLAENIEMTHYISDVIAVKIGDEIWNKGDLMSTSYSKYISLHKFDPACFNIWNEYGDCINISKDTTSVDNSFNVNIFPSRDNIRVDSCCKIIANDYSEEEILSIMKGYLKNIDISSIKCVPLSVYLSRYNGITVEDKTIKGYKYDENTKQVYRIIDDRYKEIVRCVANSISIINKFDKFDIKDESVVYTDCNNENRYIVLTRLNNELAVEVYTK